MCEWGDDVIMDLEVPAELSCTGEGRKKRTGVDRCISDIVQALNDGGIKTATCCCGHGMREGVIRLYDGRELKVISPSNLVSPDATGC